MTNSEKVKLMMGSPEDLKTLMNYYLTQLQEGVVLNDSDLIIMEFLNNGKA